MGVKDISAMETDWVWLWLINTAACVVVYLCARFAAKAAIQLPSYALPLFLTPPLTFAGLVGFCETYNSDPCRWAVELYGQNSMQGFR